MAQTLDQARKLSRTNIHGRRLGMDHDEFLVGVKDVRHVVTNATSATTGTALPNHGLVTIDSTTGDTFTLTAPTPGVSVKIVVISTGGAQVITPVSGTFPTSLGNFAGDTLTMTAGGPGLPMVELLGLSTSLWGANISKGTSAMVHFSS